jgi:CheY-like chemotaxis protein/HPt (histidine-containing phosphotransfer) domain-containing protein
MKKVLIIEDDAIVTHVYRTSLQKQGYEAESCNDGQSGLDRVQEYNPDAILLDLMLPKMNGIDLLRNIRNQNAFTFLPIIVLTNAYVPNMIQEAFSAGATQVFNKAVMTPRHLADSLDQLLHSGKPIREVTPAVAPPTVPVSWEQPGSPPPPCNLGWNDHGAPSSSPPASDAGDGKASEIELDFETEVRQAFVDAHRETLAVLRKLIRSVMDADPAAREPLLVDLYRKVHALVGSAGFVGFAEIAQLASVLEALLKEMMDQPKTVNDSTLRTVANAVEFTGELFRDSRARSAELPPAKVLIVDDECLSRRAVVFALSKAHLNYQGTDLADPAVALELAKESRFDLIFLDVQMPGINGFDLCSRIRETPLNATTPIIFVTSLSDFKSRAKSTLSGGSDLIAKPFLFVELALKAIMILLRSRVNPKRKAA